MADLAVEVGGLDDIAIGNAYCPYACASDVLRSGTAEAASAND